MTLFKTVAQTPCSKWAKKKYFYLICFGVTYKNIFLRLLTEQNWIILKLRFTRRPHAHTAKIHTLSKTLNSEFIYPV